MDDLLELIDTIKTKIKDQEYIEIMAAMQQLSIRPQETSISYNNVRITINDYGSD